MFRLVLFLIYNIISTNIDLWETVDTLHLFLPILTCFDKMSNNIMEVLDWMDSELTFDTKYFVVTHPKVIFQ